MNDKKKDIELAPTDKLRRNSIPPMPPQNIIEELEELESPQDNTGETQP